MIFKAKENVMFDDLSKDSQEVLSRIGFKKGDNISEICKNILKEENRTLEYYFSDNVVEKNKLETENKMGNKEFIELCKKEVVKYFNENVDKTDKKQITGEDVFVVWSCKTLQNNKALVSTNINDGMYYECTFNGDKQELYFDAYKKWENRCITLG